MNLPTIQDVNLANCCDCDWPECAAPRIECESMQRTRACGETDYDAEVENWEARRDDWVAGDPENRDPEDYTEDPPDEPEDYGDYDYGCYGPFTAPAGDDSDDMPTLYRRTETTTGEGRWEGAYERYVTSATEAAPYVVGSSTYAFNPLINSGNNVETLYTWSGTGYSAADFPGYENVGALKIAGTGPDRDTQGGSVSGVPFAFPSVGGGWTDETEEDEFTCTTTIQEQVVQRLTRDEGSDQELQGDMPSGGYGTHDEEFYDAVVYEKIDSVELSGGFSRAALRSEAIGDLPISWPANTVEGTDCSASLESSWPTIGDVKESDGEGGLQWVSCADGPPETTASATARRVRYKMGTPEDYEGSTWEMQWDEIFASHEWWAWFDGGMLGEEPEDGPSLVAARSWEWDGDTEDPWSDWFEIAAPTTEGETRVVNQLIICWRSTRLGTKPTSHGDVVVLPEE